MKFGDVKTFLAGLKAEREKIGEVSLATYIQQKLQVSPEEYYYDLGINPNTTTVENLFSISEHTKYLAPEIIRDAILLGMQIRRFKDRIIIKSIKENSSAIECPYIDFSGIKSTKNKPRTPAATIEQDSFVYGSKFIKTREYGKGIKFPYKYNQLKRLKIDLLPLYFQAVGIRIDTDLQESLIDIFLNGEGALDGDNNPVDESAMVIGVNDTSAGITEDDYLRAVILMSMAGKPVDTMVASDVVTRKAMKWDIFNPRLAAPPEVQLKIDIPLPASLNSFPVLNASMTNKMVLVCKQLGVIEHVAQPLSVEADLIVSKRIEEAYATIDCGYSIVYRNFRIVIDGSITYDDNQILPWLYY